MKIRRLEIQGFKSFADRTTFDFEDGITAIVGPNGCGKSNVVDAVKWVLGDMSPKSLRGKRMEDVIFAGSRHRKPLPFAEVTLVLDNADGLLKSERSEVSITRRLHRSGESDYLLHGEPARLKDIRELFLDTGLGAEGNSILEQGKIDAVLAANPVDRRGIFEEAAGVSRYKQRRKEAEQRLVRTQENLARLRDVLDLEEKRWRSLKSQAARARRYTELREELTRKRVLRAVMRYRAVAAERASLAGRMADALAREEAAARDLADLEGRAREAERARDEAREAVHALEGAVAAAAADARAARDRAAYASRAAAELRARVAAAREQAAQARASSARLMEESRVLAEEAAALVRAAAEHEGRLGEADAELSAVESEAARLRDAHDGTKRAALEALGRIGEARNEETERRAEIRQAEERLARLDRRRGEVESDRARIDGEARELAALFARLETEGRAQAEALLAAEERRADLRGAAEQARAAQAALSEDRVEKATRLELLERLLASREGIDAGARAVLAAAEGMPVAEDGTRGGVVGILADLVRPSAGGAHLLDLLLGPNAGAIVVRRSEDALRWLAWLRENEGDQRARFLCLDLVRSAPEPLPGEIGPLGAPPGIESLVVSVASGARLVPDLPAGLAAWQASGLTVVTPEGERVTASGALLGGADGPTLGLVERTAEVRALRREVARLTGEAEEARRRAAGADGAVLACEEEIRGLRGEISRRMEDKSRRGEALARVEKEARRAGQEAEALAAEVREVDRFLAEARGAAAEVSARVEAMERERAALEERAEEASRGYLALEGRRREAQERRMEIRLAAAQARGRADGARARAERGTEQAEALHERAVALEEEGRDLERRAGESDAEQAEAEALARRRDAERAQGGEDLLAARERLAVLEGAGQGEVARQAEVQRLYEEARRELEAYRLKDGEFRVRIEALAEQVRQDHGLDLAQVAAEQPPGEAIDPDAIDHEVEDLRRRMEELGNVNLNAIGELEEAEKQVTFLRTQEKDLLDGKAGLEQAITELDALSTTRFAETFERVREHFRETFRRLFGGGRAEIVLEDASNVLESGVDIVARPPGKEQRSISLLSGGERTLTAVALLFAVFQARPSPFAILDEVDAALDEANVRRLIGLVREFTDRSQFLVVTHAKTTMEAADVLYGVTMEEAGVSKKVAVRLTEFSAEASAAG